MGAYEHTPYTDSRTYEGEGGYPHYEAISSITVRSPGWSGKVVRTDTDDPNDRKFQFDLAGSMSNPYVLAKPSYTVTGHGGYVNSNPNPVIIGISLEHFGSLEVSSNFHVNQARGYKLGSNNQPELVPAFGGEVGANRLSYDDGNIFVETYKVDDGTTETETQNVGYRNCGFPAYETSPFYAELNPSWSINRANHSDGILTTDLPIFATDADLLEYINSDGLIIDKMLNKANPQDDYNKDLDYWYVSNVWGHNSTDRFSYTDYRNFHFYPLSKEKICFYRRSQSSAQPYDLGLLGYSDYTVLSAPAFSTDYEEYSGTVPSNYISNSSKFGSNDYYSVFSFQTNIPIFDSLSKATDYINGVIPISEADNYADISRDQNTEIPPEFGIADDVTDIGTNGQSYGIAGFHLYGVSHTELSSFFLEIFDVAHVQDILDGTKLFSGNEINAIMSCMYLPISDLSEICELGALTKISVASWTADHSEGTRITSNGKLIDMGSVFIPDRYGDERCYEPYQTLVLQAPYCGFYTLQCAKYVGHTMNVKYAVSVADGSCRCLVFSDGILMDSFTGTMGTMRPISAVDQAQYISNVVNGIMSTGSSIAGGMSKMAGDAMVAGGPTAAMIGTAGGVAAQGIFKGYELLQAVETPPMTTQGAITGCMGYFGPQKCHLLVGQKNSVRPANEQAVIGYPSGQGGSVSSFSGFLKCSSIKLADGFTGSEAEKNEIMQLMAQGIYL